MKKNKTTHFMTGILIIGFVALFLLVLGRFLYIQTTGEVNGVSLTKWAEKKRTSSYELPSERGKIMDENGMTLAYDRPSYRLYAIVDDAYTSDKKKPAHVTDPKKTAKELGKILKIDKSELQKKLENGIKDDKFQVEFGSEGKNLPQKTKEKIEKLHLPGIKFKKESIRYYPNGTFASQILGFASKDDGEIKGLTGIEKQKNDILSGKPGHISYLRDKYNTKLLDPKETVTKPKNGENVVLTIDQKVQTLLEDVMSQTQKKYKPKRMTAIVMNPKTGKIMAMSNRPSYNPNNPSDVKNWYNDAISTPFEPGSTMKMFTWASAIENGVYDGDDLYKSGKFKVSDRDRAVRDWKQSWGTLSFDEGFRRSSNVAASKLVWDKIGPEDFLDDLKAFDFDKKTGIDLPGEVAGNILYNYPIEKVTSSFGQGTTLTPIQQMKAASAIANDGKMVKPYVISKTMDADTGDVINETKPETVGQPISAKTAKQVRDLMRTVITGKHGTGKQYDLKDYKIAGKTGTAQIPGKNGNYMTGEENYVFSFMGMAPKDDPELMMYVSVKQPELDFDKNETGSTPVSFIFNNVMKSSLRYLDIEPDKDASNKIDPVKVPKLHEQNVKTVKKDLEHKGINVSVIGDGKDIQHASVQKGDDIFPGEHVILVTNNPKMPDITGWSLREVMTFADLLDLKLETNGNGYVKKQSIKKGEALKKNVALTVDFKAGSDSQSKDKPKKDAKKTKR